MSTHLHTHHRVWIHFSKPLEITHSSFNHCRSGHSPLHLISRWLMNFFKKPTRGTSACIKNPTVIFNTTNMRECELRRSTIGLTLKKDELMMGENNSKLSVSSFGHEWPAEPSRWICTSLYVSAPLNPLLNSTNNCTGNIVHDFGQNGGRRRRMDRQQQQKELQWVDWGHDRKLTNWITNLIFFSS